jgi:UDP-N-acetylglucosamine:LPS N-acetylglucosamine transferase
MLEKAWIISVSMGYGHQRTAYPLRFLGKIINANDYSGIPKKDKIIWEKTRNFYEAISNFYRFPVLGKLAFRIFDRFQRILKFYPKRDLSKPNFTLKNIYSLFRKGWCNHLIESLKEKNPNLPIISTFFTPAFAAEFFEYPGEIFCVVCDADISRTWAPLNPKESKIKYFAPNERVVERLKLYGVKSENIFLTGYPLPLENLGKDLEILKKDLKNRLLNLDPKRKYFEKYKILIEKNLGKLPEKSDHLLTLMFSVGGAGAQKEIARKILKSLREKIKKGEIKIILSAGTKEKVKNYFEKIINDLGLRENLKREIEIIFEKKIEDYFEKFNLALRKTDILWTKPSELSFYSALGIPILISPPIGSQEEFNMRYLLKSGFGIFQENPDYTKEWLFDWLEQGYLAEAAMQGFVEGEKLGTLKISQMVTNLSTNIQE